MMYVIALGRPPATEIVTVGKFLFVLRSPAGAEVARPERKISSVARRPLSGISSMRAESMICPTLVVWRSTSVVEPCTVSCSVCAPTFSVTSSDGFVFTCSTMPSWTNVVNPESSILI